MILYTGGTGFLAMGLSTTFIESWLVLAFIFCLGAFFGYLIFRAR